MIELDDRRARPFLTDDALNSLWPAVRDAHDAVLNKTGAGSDMLGWRDLVPRAADYRAALEAWRPLAEADNAEAQVALADLYASGALGAARPGQAAQWYRRAAEQGHAMAQLNLGDMYARGAGVPRDPVRAYVWLSLAARQGRAWAERRRREIVVRLTPAEATKATALLIEIRNRLYLLESEGGSR